MFRKKKKQISPLDLIDPFDADMSEEEFEDMMIILTGQLEMLMDNATAFWYEAGDDRVQVCFSFFGLDASTGKVQDRDREIWQRKLL